MVGGGGVPESTLKQLEGNGAERGGQSTALGGGAQHNPSKLPPSKDRPSNASCPLCIREPAPAGRCPPTKRECGTAGRTRIRLDGV